MNDDLSPVIDVPAGLLGRGSAFWIEMLTELEFDTKETALVLEAARVLDRIDQLAEAIEADGLTVKGSMGQTVIHPAVAELRQQQAAFARLIGGVNLPDDDAAADRFKYERAKAGSDARWNGAGSRRLRAVDRG
jgi:hypothetical protein